MELKKKRFLDAVVRASKSLDVEPPRVQFWEDKCPYDTGHEMAHIHYDTAVICVSEKKLRDMNYDDIENTATHEVTHLSDIVPEQNPNHSSDFYRRHDEVKVSSWRPEGAGVVVIDGNGRSSTKKTKKEKHVVDKKVCNRWGICDKKSNLKECPYCKNFYCHEHHDPFEPGLGLHSKSNDGHPCPDWIEYKLSQQEQSDKRYRENLNKIIHSDEEFKLTTHKHSYVPSKMAGDEPLTARSLREYDNERNRREESFIETTHEETKKDRAYEEETNIKANCVFCGKLTKNACRCYYCGRLFCSKHKYYNEHNCDSFSAPEKKKSHVNIEEPKKSNQRRDYSKLGPYIEEAEEQKKYHKDYIDSSKNNYVFEKPKKSFWGKVKCFFGYHLLEKVGGPENIGNGEFQQKFRCDRCKKMIKRIS